MTDDSPEAMLRAAREAVVFTLPLYEMARMRAATTPRRHPSLGFAADDPASPLRWVNTFTHTGRLLGPADREVVSPNNDTLYTNAWLDLASGPVLIDVPAIGERYWTLGFLDMWTNPFAYAGRRTTGGRSQRLFVHRAADRGAIPERALPIEVPGDDVWVIGRILVAPDDDDVAAVRALQRQFAILRANPPHETAACVLDAAIDGRRTDVPPVARYRSVVAGALARNPAPAAHAAAIANAARFGLTGAASAPAAANAADDDGEATEAALAQALAEVCAELRDAPHASDAGGGWSIPVTVRRNYDPDHFGRARVARNLIGALGIEEAMYVLAEVDGEDRPLDGRHRYEIRFAPDALPQVDAFWSLTMYRRADCLLVDNPIDRYSIGDRTPGLRPDADGGLTIRVQAEAPEPGVNWLPAPRESFYLALRLYQPRAPHLELRFPYPPVRRLD